MKRSTFILLACVLAAASAGCQTVQTTSGKQYLGTYQQDVAASQNGTSATKQPLDKEIMQAAAVEPLLRFPARIGLARIGVAKNYWGSPSLAPIPATEGKLWQEAAKNLGPSFGEFVPVSPLIAELFDDQRESSRAREIVRKIRLAAARQHLDAVIIYESEGTADSSNNPLSIADWTLIGLFIVPGQDVEARGIAQAMLIDVRNGYPYGTAQAEAKDTSITVRVATGEAEDSLAESARVSAVQKLIPEVEKMMLRLRTELAEKRSKPASKSVRR